MAALARIKLTGSNGETSPKIVAAPKDQARVKRKLELLAERTVEQAQELIDSRIEENEPLCKDDVAIVEHASTNAIRVFNLGAAAAQSSLGDKQKPRLPSFAGLRLIGAKEDKAKPSEKPKGG